jgi:hypothetical protein
MDFSLKHKTLLAFSVVLYGTDDSTNLQAFIQCFFFCTFMTKQIFNECLIKGPAG